MKKVLIVSTSDIHGGAARAASRIHKGLLAKNVHSRMLVQNQSTHDHTVIGPSNYLERLGARLNPRLDELTYKLRGGINAPIFSSARYSLYPVLRKIRKFKPDIVNLHWVSGGMVQLGLLRQLDCPVVWTMHDMWPFTGGCHYDNECGRFVDACGNCPQLNKNKSGDLSHQTIKKKTRLFKPSNYSVITPSRWLAERARESSVMNDREIKVIANGVDLDVFKPLDKNLARQIWNLQPEKKVVLFGAMCSTSDSRKGFDLLLPAIKQLTQDSAQNLQLVIFGNDTTEFGPDVKAVGTLADEISLATLYSAADVMVVPSRQDNLPNTAVESIACGTPVVGFDVGGISDIVDHEVNGYLANPFEHDDLAYGINWIISNEERTRNLSLNARVKARSCFDVAVAASNYLKHFEYLIENEHKTVATQN